MADPARLNEILEQLNTEMGEITPYKLAMVDPKEIVPVDKNAHYMSKKMFDQLVANVEADKNLSSLPFCWKRKDGTFVALSGNHRVAAAAKANIPLVLVLYTDDKLSRSEQVAIQLSHNALVGQDNPTQLVQLWEEIKDIKWKVYTGLDDGLLATMAAVNVARLNEEPLRFEELVILFIPTEIKRIEEMAKRLGPVSRTRFAAAAEEFDGFFQALLNLKEATGIINTATVFLLLTEIVNEYLENKKSESLSTESELKRAEQ